MADFILRYGEYTVDPHALPETSVQALLSRGFAHVLGNEVSSKIVSRIRREIRGDLNEVASSEQVKAFRRANPDVIEAWEIETEQGTMQALIEGTLGVRPAGTERVARVDPLTREVRKIALAEISEICKTNQLVLPKGKNKVTFPNGDSFTRENLIERRIVKHGERITKEATKVLANATKAAATDLDL